MKVRRVVFVTVVITVAVGLAVWTRKGVQACGPDWEPDVFVNAQMPDDMAAFAAGHLGLLGAKFDSDEYAIAYRYLNGGTLSADDQKLFAPLGSLAHQDWDQMTPEQMGAAVAEQKQQAMARGGPGQWLLASAQYAPDTDEQKPELPQDDEGSPGFGGEYLNCPDATFAMAIQTLHARAAAWGAQSAWLKDWIAGQDAVFANCTKNPAPPEWAPRNAPPAKTWTMSVPDAAPANAPLLLQQDRAYQVAAATFYFKKFDEAAQEFAAIAQDKKSPWSAWGTYLAARATVRQAFAMGKATDAYAPDLADFDKPTMQKAQRMLEGLLEKKDPQPSRSAVEHELQFVLLRTDAQRRVNDLCAALEGPGPDATFASDVADLNFVLVKQIEVKEKPPLMEWIANWRGPVTDPAAPARWEKTHSLPWLVVALARTNGTDAATPKLLAVAAQVKPGTPGYETVFYHRVRLLEEMKRADEARGLLDGSAPGALPEAIRQKPNSYANALLGERMAVARNFEEFLTYAPRTDLSESAAADEKAAWSCAGNPVWTRELGGCPTAQQPPAFDVDAVTVFNREMPLEMLVQAAQSERVPPNLRGYLVLAAWTRAVVLQDAANAAKLAPMLPPAIRDAVGTDVGFKADVAILRNPGLRPYLESGVTRLADFTERDHYRDNWWDSQWAGRFSPGSDAAGDNIGSGVATSEKLSIASFLTPAQAAKGEAEAERVLKLPGGAALIGQRVLAYAKAHAEDPAVPEALALTVRATRYGAEGFGDDAEAKERAAESTAVSKAAFTLLHSRYPQTEWAKKTKYYY
jgi:hypothetical protein